MVPSRAGGQEEGAGEVTWISPPEEIVEDTLLMVYVYVVREERVCAPVYYRFYSDVKGRVIRRVSLSGLSSGEEGSAWPC